ncbi:MAG: SpoIIE family protein phosphatase [Fibrobacteraceae bacterium]|nr:SpoIIE family protein phosphatase [Fibrobacteraceae bacterium]
MIPLLLYPLIPLISAFPLFVMLLLFYGKSQVKKQWVWLLFSFVFFLWEGYIARFVTLTPVIRIVDLFLFFVLLILFVREENTKVPESKRKPFLLKGFVAFLFFSVLQIIFSYCMTPPLFFASLLCSVALAFYYERLYVYASCYPKFRFRLLFFFFILSSCLVLPVFRLLFLGEVAYIFYRRYVKWIDLKDNSIRMFKEERLLNHQIVSKMGDTVHDFSDLHTSLSHYLQNLVEGIEAKSAAIYMWNAKLQKFHCVELHGVFFPLVRGNEMSFTHVDALKEIALSGDIDDRTNIVWECGMSRMGIHVPYASQDGRILSLGSRAANIRTLILEPLYFDQELLGVLVVENKLYERYFTESDAYLVRNFAHYATMILKAHDAALERQSQIRTQAELQLGYRIQAGLLPSKIPDFEGISLAGSMMPAKEIGGDYFDFLKLPNESLGIIIGDVSGKGVPAGMVMTSLYAFLHAECRYFVNTYRTLVQVNAELAQHISENMFASLLFFEWNPNKKSLHYTSCGHEYILHFHYAENRLDAIKSGGVALGMIDDNSKIIREKSLQVLPGDTIVLYTDGVTECTNMEGAMFGLERLKSFVEKHQALSSEEIRLALLDELNSFAHGAPQADDITILVMKF